jgi:adenosylcobinamide kinase/adenosylcobinamide-phosphate guanylyltransferase
MSLTLILGGARSGKSDLAVRLAEASGRNVLFVATMQPSDDDVRARIEAHRAARPVTWRTVEEPLELTGVLEREGATGSFVIVDCLTLWVSNLLLTLLSDESPQPAQAAAAVNDVVARAGTLLTWCVNFDGEVALVSNEVGLGVVPAFPLGRVFRDALGAVNMRAAASAHRVLQCSAGLVLDLKERGAVPLDAYANRARSW